MKLFFLILLVGLLTLFQVLDFSIFGVKPNLAMVAAIIVSFFIVNSQWLVVRGFLPVVLAALILKFSPGFESEILVFTLIGAGALIVKKYLPYQNFLNSALLIIVATVVFYLVLAHNMILSVIFAKELFLNLVAGVLIFAFLSLMRQNKII